MQSSVFSRSSRKMLHAQVIVVLPGSLQPLVMLATRIYMPSNKALRSERYTDRTAHPG